MPKYSRNRQRRGRSRTAHTADLAARRAFTQRRYWHGGAPGLDVGTVLLNRLDATQQSIDLTLYLDRPTGDPTREDRVYFTTDIDLARAFAGDTRVHDGTTGVILRNGDLYEVEPIGPIVTDPDFPRAGLCAPGARIVAVAERNVSLDRYETNRLRGRDIRWKDGSPVYSQTGGYIRSPEQMAGGYWNPLFELVLPWTPVAMINSWIEGQPSDDRPDPSECPGIMLGAAEAGPVLLRHRVRAERLIAAGVEFASPAGDQVAQMNTLLDGATVYGKADEPRGAIVAIDGAGRVVAAMVMTALAMGGSMWMFIDTVRTAERWRGNGVASVMLLAAQQLLPQRPRFVAGQCPISTAPFFAQMGFTVLRPGQPLVTPAADTDSQTGAIPGGDDYCWFYRQGPA